MLLIIDHYDSFIDMIADYCKQLGMTYKMLKTDQLNSELISELSPSRVIIGPGPGHPLSPELAATRRLLGQVVAAKIPLLGICLGHQLIAASFDARIEKSKPIAHGLISTICHSNDDLFQGIPKHFEVTRYHSLIVANDSLINTPLRATALCESGQVMAIRYPGRPIYGLQFHPESVTTRFGLAILKNFLYRKE